MTGIEADESVVDYIYESIGDNDAFFLYRYVWDEGYLDALERREPECESEGEYYDIGYRGRRVDVYHIIVYMQGYIAGTQERLEKEEL